jgi:IS30 family transposase
VRSQLADNMSSTMFTILAKLANAKASSVVDGFSHVLNPVEVQKCLSVSDGQGREMSNYQSLTAQTVVKVYFADSHGPWQHGMNENTNGLLKQHFLKGMELSEFTQEELDPIAWRLISRPRKIMGFKFSSKNVYVSSFDFKINLALLFEITP